MAHADAFSDFWKCPTTGRVISSTKGDNKASCDCGVKNPASMNCTEIVDGMTLHFKFALKPATAIEMAKQRDLDRATALKS